MKPDTENKITAQFNKLKSSYLEHWERDGIIDMIKKISTLIHTLQEAGLDVSIEIVQPTAQHTTFAGRGVVFAGNIRCGNTERLLAFSIKEDYGYFLHVSRPLAANREGIAEQEYYQIFAQTELHGLQERLISDCVQQEIIAECDIAQIFSNNKKITKPPFHKLPRHD